MKVSVVIPTRNRLAFLQNAIASVQAQTYSDWEAIIIDDASTDGSWQWLASFREPRIRGVHLEQHCERSAARNRGVREAGGEMVLFLDDDDRLKPHALACLTAELEKHTDAIAAVGGRVYFDDRGQDQEFTLSHWRVKRVIWPEILFGLVPAQGEALIRMSTLIATCGWKEHLALAEDHEFWLRLATLGPVVTIPDTVLEVRVHAGQSPRTGVPGRTKDFRRAFVNKLPSERLRHFGAIKQVRALSGSVTTNSL
jgi:glycosyltransferase involved in cell wall biosynthesis